MPAAPRQITMRAVDRLLIPTFSNAATCAAAEGLEAQFRAAGLTPTTGVRHILDLHDRWLNGAEPGGQLMTSLDAAIRAAAGTVIAAGDTPAVADGPAYFAAVD